MAQHSQRVIDRLMATVTVNAETGCWESSYAKTPSGYRMMGIDNKKVMRIHRVAYEAFVGEVPDGLVLDHLCRNRGCCNPEHLEPVTNQENVNRGLLGDMRRYDICRRGHTLVDAYTLKNGVRRCKWCRAEDRVKWKKWERKPA